MLSGLCTVYTVCTYLLPPVHPACFCSLVRENLRPSPATRKLSTWAQLQHRTTNLVLPCPVLSCPSLHPRRGLCQLAVHHVPSPRVENAAWHHIVRFGPEVHGYGVHSTSSHRLVMLTPYAYSVRTQYAVPLPCVVATTEKGKPKPKRSLPARRRMDLVVAVTKTPHPRPEGPVNPPLGCSPQPSPVRGIHLNFAAFLDLRTIVFIARGTRLHDGISNLFPTSRAAEPRMCSRDSFLITMDPGTCVRKPHLRDKHLDVQCTIHTQ